MQSLLETVQKLNGRVKWHKSGLRILRNMVTVAIFLNILLKVCASEIYLKFNIIEKN